MQSVEIFKEPPPNFRARFGASACLCHHEDKVLFLMRHPSKNFGGQWCLPGGKIEHGEEHKTTAKRELFEETSIVVPEENLLFLDTFYLRYPRLDFIYHFYSCKLDSLPEKIALATDEHTDFEWKKLHPIDAHTLIAGEKACLTHLTPKLLF